MEGKGMNLLKKNENPQILIRGFIRQNGASLRAS